MPRTRLTVLTLFATAAVAVAACGSVAPSGESSTPTTTPVKKLDLASVGTAPTRAAAEGIAPSIMPLPPTRYALDAALPDLGRSAVVLRLRAHTLDASDVQRFADALGVAGVPKRTPSGWKLQGADAMLSFFVGDGVTQVSYAPGTPGPTGGGSGRGAAGGTVGAAPSGSVVNGPIKIAPAPPGPPTVPPTVAPAPVPPADVPTAGEAETAARALLDRLGVLGGQKWQTAVNDDGVAYACAPGMACPAIDPAVSQRTVTFSLLLDSARVDGVDWSVTIGAHRRVESLNGNWASPDPIGPYPLRSTAAVFSDLQHGTARDAGPQPMTALGRPDAPATAPGITTSPVRESIVVHVTGVALGVTRWDAYDNGKVVVDLVPTYRFHARVDGGGSYDIEVLALEPSAATFTKPPPYQVPLPAPALLPDTPTSRP